MASRRDQLQSHQFLTQRVISALVMRETDPAQSPLRRGIGAVFAGLMIAVMVGAGFGVYGLLTKTGSSGWKTDGAVIIEKETGAPYVYQGGELHPMLNYASALLATGGAARAVYNEPADALSGVPRGVMLGIPYAPDSVPDAAHTVRAPWTLCTAATVDGSGSQSLTTTLALARTPSGSVPLGDQGLLVRDPATSLTYLVWHGARYAVAASVLPALFGAPTPIPAGTAWLNGLPRGADIAPLTITGNGSPSPAAGAYDIGAVLSTQVGTGGVQYWLVLSDGLAPITELQEDIVVSQGAAAPRTISAVDAAAIHRSDQLAADTTIAATGPAAQAGPTAGRVQPDVCRFPGCDEPADRHDRRHPAGRRCRYADRIAYRRRRGPGRSHPGTGRPRGSCARDGVGHQPGRRL